MKHSKNCRYHGNHTSATCPVCDKEKIAMKKLVDQYKKEKGIWRGK